MIDSTFLKIQLARLLHETSKDLETAEWCAENSASHYTRNKWAGCKEIMINNSTKYGSIPMGDDTQDTIQKRVFDRGVQMEKIYRQIMESQNRDVARRIEAEKRSNILEDALMSLLADTSTSNQERIKKILTDVIPVPKRFIMRKPAQEQEYLEE